MIPEAIEWCVTPCPWFARRSGLLAAQIAIRHRAIRCRSAWKPHLDACRSFFSAAIGSGPREGRVVILGSGHLNDFDLRFLQSRFEKLTLVDAVHPLEIQVRALISKGRIELRSTDLSTPEKFIADLVAQSDWAISSCLLSQLPLFARRGDSRSIFSRHLELLILAPRSILITDVAERTVGQAEWSSILDDFPLPPADAEWIWTIAPTGENGPRAQERLVRACRKSCPGLVFEINARQSDNFQR
jgi:hypothetical protein